MLLTVATLIVAVFILVFLFSLLLLCQILISAYQRLVECQGAGEEERALFSSTLKLGERIRLQLLIVFLCHSLLLIMLLRG